MAHSNLVSIILIFFNAELFIEPAINSVLDQTYPGWELLLIDDGSEDSSSQIAQHFAEYYPDRIRYYTHPNHQNCGMSASRNLGIQQAQGEFITFLDADDLWLPHKLYHQVEIFKEHPEIAFVCNPAQWWYSWTGKPEDRCRDFIQTLAVDLDAIVQPPTLLQLFLQDEWASLCDLLIRRSIVESLGGYETTFRGMYEDQVFHTKLCAQHIGFVSSQWGYRYRQHPQACTSTSHQSGQTNQAREVFLRWLTEYLLSHGMESSMIWSIVQRKLLPYRYPKLFRRINFLKIFWIKLTMKSTSIAKSIANKLFSGLPIFFQEWIRVRRHGREYRPPIGRVNLGSLNRLTPIADDFGFDRGTPIDRYYIEKFLLSHRNDIKGHILEIGDDVYTYQFGNPKYIVKSDILHVVEGNSKATIIGDLTNAEHIPDDQFDCIILAQTLHLIYNMPAALETIRRILKPNGVLLATFPGISQQSSFDDDWSSYWCWGLTSLSTDKLLHKSFPDSQKTIQAFGNVLSSIAFLQGLAASELSQSDLDFHDPRYEMLITMRVVKSSPGD